MKRTVILLFSLFISFAVMLAQDPVEIVFNGTTATYTIPKGVTGVSIGKNGAKVTVTCTNTAIEYTYRVSGSSDNGSLTINGDYKLTLLLTGLTLTNATSGAAIDIECGKRVNVVLEEGTVNTISDSNKGSQKGAFYTKGHVEFRGGGTLNITGKLKHAISIKEYCELKSNLGTINILGAINDGIHCGKGNIKDENNYFRMKGGTLNISGVGDDGIDTDNYGVLAIDSGTVNITVADDAIALKADSTVTINDGKVTINVSGKDSKAIRANYAVNITGGENTINVSGDGSKAIKGNRYLTGSTVLKGGNVNISGGNTDITVSGGNIITTGTDGVADTTKCMGISADADLIQTGGNVTIKIKGSEAKGYNVKGTETRTGGTLTVITDDETKKGDVNGDGSVDVADISAIITIMANATPIPSDSADVNGDGTVDVADISAVISIMAGN